MAEIVNTYPLYFHVMKDNFSAQSKAYATFRPVFPIELFDFIYQHVKQFNLAWDVGTGNGQTAAVLADHFQQVYATDISHRQLSHAQQKQNIVYKVEPAEQTCLIENTVDLITVSQAIHWFDFDGFYNEVKRVANTNCIVAAFAYSMFSADDEDCDVLIKEFYRNSGPYWDKERRFIDEKYRTIPFPFNEISAPQFSIECSWKMEQVIGYFETWSANQAHLRQHGIPLVTADFVKRLKKCWPITGVLNLSFPVYLRIGTVRDAN